MQLTLSEILPHLIYSFKSEDDLVKSIEEISLKFTTNRDRISDYLKDPRLVAAYTAFYLLTNIPKIGEVLKWLPDEWIRELKNCNFIDLGAGPGTFSLAWKELGCGGDFFQIESSPLMKEQGLKLWQGLYSSKLFQGTSWVWETDKPRFLLFGHSANEMGVAAAIRYIEQINPEHILFIEPGTKDFFREMLEIRNYLLKNNFHLLYPCPKPHECPMRNSAEDWCHQFIHVKHEAEVERLSQMVRKDRKLLPLTVQAFSRTFSTQNPNERLVRVMAETKFSHEWEVCHDNQLKHYQLMKKDFSKSESKEIGSILAGEAIQTETIKNLESFIRVKLVKVHKLNSDALDEI